MLNYCLRYLTIYTVRSHVQLSLHKLSDYIIAKLECINFTTNVFITGYKMLYIC